MRWDRFFDDLEDQLSSEWEAERVALETEAERLRLSRVTLRERLMALAAEGAASEASLELCDGAVVRGTMSGVGADWVALALSGARGGALVPLPAVAWVGMPESDLLRSARPLAARSSLSDRITFGFVVRDLGRRRSGVEVHLSGGRVLTGTIDRAGIDHLDLAQHEAGAPRRVDAVTGHRIVPFAAIAWVRVADERVFG
ncbi:hypothetical protein GCM10022200_11340 [Microbacterium awajiense]|uniref:Uncharacterized protein n=1 Tax=Microbacterium awajiense TaxID=415214 RepID=A0ABP7AEE6_9MICO